MQHLDNYNALKDF